jgi:hypothetical protein
MWAFSLEAWRRLVARIAALEIIAAEISFSDRTCRPVSTSDAKGPSLTASGVPNPVSATRIESTLPLETVWLHARYVLAARAPKLLTAIGTRFPNFLFCHARAIVSKLDATRSSKARETNVSN